MKTRLFLTVLCLVLVGSASRPVAGQQSQADAALRKKNGFRELENVNPKLPNVLLVGDSICNGYDDQVRE